MAGVAEGCRQAGCALVGGETAEMPGMYADGEYDIAGYTTGVVEKSKLIDGSKVKVGDVLVGIASCWSALQRFQPRAQDSRRQRTLPTPTPSRSSAGRLLGDVLLTPTRIYVKQVLEVICSCDVHGVAHITGGGFDENIPRSAARRAGSRDPRRARWEILPVFRFLEKYGAAWPAQRDVQHLQHGRGNGASCSMRVGGRRRP